MNIAVVTMCRAPIYEAVAATQLSVNISVGTTVKIKSTSLMSIDHNLPPGLNYIASRPPTSLRCGEEH